MEDSHSAMQSVLQDTLDNLVSGRSSTAKRSQSLNDLERVIAQIFTSPEVEEKIESFLALQDTFECNVPSRILGWISVASTRLDSLLSRGLSESDREVEASSLCTQLVQALSIVQGVALTHRPTKLFLGRKYPLEVLLELLLVTRHLVPSSTDTPPSTGPSTPTPSAPKTSSNQKSTPPPLASAVLDTLLCILVDLPPALRIFEAINGVQIIVKLLKRANTPRDVRMKCLEFLYFYLLDETSPNLDESNPGLPGPPSLPPMPLSPSPFITDSRQKGAARPLRDASSGSDESYTSGSSRASSYSLSSNTSIDSTPSTPPPREVRTPPHTPTNPATRPFAKPRSLMLLQQDVEFVPLSPKKSQAARLGVAHARQGSVSTPNPKQRSHLSDYSRTDVFPNQRVDAGTPSRPGSDDLAPEGHMFPSTGGGDEVKTTEEKKEFLGRMLGNVDALVEGVKKAGVWGLG